MEQLFEPFKKKFYGKYQVDLSDKFNEFEEVAGYVDSQYSKKEPTPSYNDFQREVLKQGWQHFEEQVIHKVDNLKALDFVNSYDDYRGDQTNALKGLYQNTGYGRERQEMMSLVVDSDNQTAAGVTALAGGTTTFSIDLPEPLLIDKLSSVYLDNITTVGILKNINDPNGKDMCMLLEIDQFNINTKGTGRTTAGSTTNYLNDKIVIPNSSSDGGNIVTTHKGNKFNYIAQINPQKITKISGSITGLGANSEAPVTIFEANARFIIEFLIVAVDKMSWK